MAGKKAAPKSKLEQLHSILTECFIAILAEAKDDNGRIKKDDDGKPIVTSAHLNAARQFLSDNDIEADPSEHSPNGDAFGNLKEKLNELPFSPETTE